MSYSVKSIRKQFSEKGVFYTDTRLAELLRDTVSEGGTVREVYDPTCGCGNLLAVFPDHISKYGQEINPEQAEEARQRLANAHIATGDTLTEPAFAERKFGHIVANYPFSIKWQPAADARWNDAPALPPPSKADYAFILHIISMLDDHGVAATLNFPGILYRGQREEKIRTWLVERSLIESVTRIEGGYFEDTNIETALIVFRKGRTATGIKFSDHETGKEYIASLEEVRQNGFNLSPSGYIQPDEPVTNTIDPAEKEIEARACVLKHIKRQLEFSKAAIEAHEILGLHPLPPLSDFVNDIKSTVKPYENMNNNNPIGIT